MRRVILNVAMTLDGFIEGPNGELDWLVRDDKIDFGDILNEILIFVAYGRSAPLVLFVLLNDSFVNT
ncbi:dihydrofolate reductase family protein [Solitalea sp. MAHUQ-68]|uniref:Dihydrofolate reductase family protein n=1 Tax=Solitalea agri TaxID=2953739 RepID=A0A9X2F4A5_9SPHI|nr:dihydrofolate reductase family protein [Solitalea agri]MCO4294539.1 dihydrofolate reductase family protein [Solitalea agri]